MQIDDLAGVFMLVSLKYYKPNGIQRAVLPKNSKEHRSKRDLPLHVVGPTCSPADRGHHAPWTSAAALAGGLSLAPSAG